MHRKAVSHLKKVDPALALVIKNVGPCRFCPPPLSEGTHFDYIIASIVGQQLSVKAAATIRSRVMKLLSGRRSRAEQLAAMPDEKLRAAGLSRQKLSYLKDFAQKVVSNELPIAHLHELSDEDVIAHLTQVKGIGRWTAQMFLMFRLGRPDVLPLNDLGILKSIQQTYKLKKLPTPKQVTKIGQLWSPYATVACWYLWRSLDQK